MSTDSFDLKWLKRKFFLWTLQASACVEARGRWFLVYGYSQESPDSAPAYQVVAAVEERTEISPYMPLSTLWKAAEISVSRRNDWLVFSRVQDDLSTTGLKDFAADSSSYLEYLLGEAARNRAVREKD